MAQSDFLTMNEHWGNIKLQTAIPNGLSIIRLAAGAGLLLFVSPPCRFDMLLYVYLLLASTDVLDGWLARRWGVCSRAGFYLDACADFVAVLSAFILFMRCGFLTMIAPMLITAVFLYFIFTAHIKTKGYDPLGKYFGAWLYLIVISVLATPDCGLKVAAAPAIYTASVLVLASRTTYLLSNSKA
jgi:phosphatidylglycerophosphate synthase